MLVLLGESLDPEVVEVLLPQEQNMAAVMQMAKDRLIFFINEFLLGKHHKIYATSPLHHQLHLHLFYKPGLNFCRALPGLKPDLQKTLTLFYEETFQ
jgi:hypothetical protein